MQFEPLRRSRQALSEEECFEILKRNSNGVLSLIPENDWPYGVPLNYGLDDQYLYFHCARKGKKLDAIRHNNRASFCVIDQDEIHKEEYTSYFRSVILFGRIEILEKPEDILYAIRNLSKRYYPEDSEEHLNEVIERNLDRLCMLRFKIEHVSGKQAIELISRED